MRKRNKTAAAFLLALFLAQTASACSSIQPKNPNPSVHVLAGQTVPFALTRDLVTHEPSCQGSGSEMSYQAFVVADSNICSLVTVSSSGLEIKGLAPGQTIITWESQCTFSTSSPSAQITLDITVSAPPSRPASGGTSNDLPAPRQPYEQAVIGNVSGPVTVYSGPGTHHKALGKVSPGDTIELLQWAESETWCKAFYNGGNNVGWIQGKFIIPRK